MRVLPLGYDTVTGKMELVPQTDPDSLKLAAKGDLIFSRVLSSWR
jgi:hypothetical protein